MSPNAAASVRTLIHGFWQLYPEEAAAVLEEEAPEESARLIRELSLPDEAQVFQRLTPAVAEQVLARLDDASCRRVLTRLDPARAAILLSRVDEEERRRKLTLLDEPLAKELQTLIAYPVDSAGSLMDPRVTTFRPEMTAEQALSRLRELRHKRIYDVFLVDGEGELVGAVALQDLAVAPTTARLEELARGEPAAVRAMATREEVVEELSKRGLASLAVVDFDGRLAGVIRHDALMRAVEEETSLDVQTMVGVSKEERALSKASFAVRKRLPWLQINLVTAFLAAAVVGLFEETIARFTALAVLLPVVAGQSGNTGAQALAVTMRGLAIREVRTSHWLRIASKEITVASINGCAVALTTALGVYIWSQSFGLAMVIGISMVISMVAAGLAGAAIPMLLTAMGQDPAQSSSIILTTVTDVVGFFSFLGIATLMAAAL